MRQAVFHLGAGGASAFCSSPALSAGEDQLNEQRRVVLCVCVMGIDVTLESSCKIAVVLSSVKTCLESELPSLHIA